MYEWIPGDEPADRTVADGDEPADRTVADWATFGRELAGFVHSFHGIDVTGAEPDESLRWYRGQPLADFADDGVATIRDDIAPLVEREGLDIDVTALCSTWEALAAIPQPHVDPVLLHGDLRAANLLVRDGRLAAVIDFGTMSIGQPMAEHGPIWSFPPAARVAYREELHLDDDAWHLALGWALLPSLTGLSYYWDRWPDFAHGCLERIQLVLREAAGL